MRILINHSTHPNKVINNEIYTPALNKNITYKILFISSFPTIEGIKKRNLSILLIDIFLEKGGFLC